MSPPHDPLVAGRYRLDDRLGAGAFGEVHAGWDTVLDRPVAIKLLRVHSPEAARRFRREARVAARLRSPHAVPTFDVGEARDGRLYMVMEYVRGETVRARLARGPLPVERALTLCDELCALLVEAHALGLVHRDIKPANLMLDRLDGHAERLRVLDFGVAKVSEGDGTSTHGVVGTPGYIAPEVWQEQPVDARADLYAVGLVLYEMLAGRPAVSARSLHGAVRAHLFDPLPRLDAARAPAEVDRFVARMTARDPDDRPADARAARVLLAQLRGLTSPPAPLAVDAAPVPADGGPPTAGGTLDDADDSLDGAARWGGATRLAASGASSDDRSPTPSADEPRALEGGARGPGAARHRWLGPGFVAAAGLAGLVAWTGAPEVSDPVAPEAASVSAAPAAAPDSTRAPAPAVADDATAHDAAPAASDAAPAAHDAAPAAPDAAVTAHPSPRRRVEATPAPPTVRVTSAPAGARVWIDDRLVGATPLDVPVDRPTTVMIDAPDHYRAPVQLRPGQDPVRVELEPVVRLP